MHRTRSRMLTGMPFIDHNYFFPNLETLPRTFKNRFPERTSQLLPPQPNAFFNMSDNIDYCLTKDCLNLSYASTNLGDDDGDRSFALFDFDYHDGDGYGDNPHQANGHDSSILPFYRQRSPSEFSSSTDLLAIGIEDNLEPRHDDDDHRHYQNTLLRRVSTTNEQHEKKEKRFETTSSQLTLPLDTTKLDECMRQTNLTRNWIRQNIKETNVAVTATLSSRMINVAYPPAAVAAAVLGPVPNTTLPVGTTFATKKRTTVTRTSKRCRTVRLVSAAKSIFRKMQGGKPANKRNTITFGDVHCKKDLSFRTSFLRSSYKTLEREDLGSILERNRTHYSIHGDATFSGVLLRPSVLGAAISRTNTTPSAVVSGKPMSISDFIRRRRKM